MAGFHRFTVDEYHKLIEIGLLTEDDNLELLEGYLVQKMSRNPPHDGTLQLVIDALAPHLSAGWCLRQQSAVTMTDSEPEPDVAVVRGDKRSYLTHHPGPADVGLVVEVAETTLPSDRTDKLRIYARAGIPVYWIVNLTDRQVEVYGQPSGPTANPDYATRQTYKPGDGVPVVLDGQPVGNVPAAELLP
jgi:Uma2 family endonuclease